MKLYGLITKITKSEDDDAFHAEILLPNGDRIAAIVGPDDEVGDTVIVESTPKGPVITPFSYYEKTKVHSPKYGFVYEKDNAPGDGVSVLELGSNKKVGEPSQGHFASSKTGAYIGHGITNYTYYDDTTMYTKTLNKVSIEGNVISGSSLQEGVSATFHLHRMHDDKYIKMKPKDFKGALKSNIDNLSFLINTVGIHGMLYLLGSSIYKIEGSGQNCLANFLSIQDISIGDETISTNLVPIKDFLSKYIDISLSASFSIHLYPKELLLQQTDSSTQTMTGIEVSVTLFNEEYFVNSITVSHADGMFEFSRNKHIISDSLFIENTNTEIKSDNIYIPKPFFLNKDTNQLSIANNGNLIVNISQLELSVDTYEVHSQDHIILQTGKKGILIDYSGTSNL